MVLLSNSGVWSNVSQRVVVSDADYAAVELFQGYADSLLTFAVVCCVISMVVGIPGNIVTIIALARYKRARNATALFVMSLACADLLFCCIVPPLSGSAFWNRAWTHGRALCRLYPLAKYALITVTSLTILAITINRYIIIVHPRIYRKVYQKRNLGIMLAAIWISAVAVFIPTLLGKWGRFDLDPTNGSCTIIVPDQNKRSLKQILLLTVFSLPCIPMIFCYLRIYFVVRKATLNSQNIKTNKKTPSSSDQNTTRGDLISITVKTSSADSGDTDDEKDTGYAKASTAETRNETTVSDDITNEDPPERSRSPRIQRNLLKSMRLLSLSLPTRKDKRLKSMILAIMMRFFLGQFPVILTKALRYVTTPTPGFHIAAYVLFYFSYCMNPLIYVVMSSEYKKAYKNLFCGK